MVDLGRIQVHLLLLLSTMVEAGTYGAASLLRFHRADASVLGINLHERGGSSIEIGRCPDGSLGLDSPCILLCRKSCER